MLFVSATIVFSENLFLVIHVCTPESMIEMEQLLSYEFSVTNGVKQGGIISSLLVFITVLVDDLLIKLKNSGYGCVMGENCVDL